MNTIELFRNYLLQNLGTSKITAKNYVSDVNKFIRWFETKKGREFVPSDFDEITISDFINERGSLIDGKGLQNGLNSQANLSTPYSAKSFDRYLSSLRRFAIFLLEASLIPSNPFLEPSTINHQSLNRDPWHLKSFKNFLYVGGASSLTSKNYMVDINAFTSWLEYKSLHTDNLSNYIESINPGVIEDYKTVLSEELGLSSATINRKLSTIRKYLSFASKAGLLPEPIKPPAEPNVVLPIVALPEADITADLDAIAKEEGEMTLGELESETSNTQSPTANPQYSPFPPLRLLQKLTLPYFMFEERAALALAGFVSGKSLTFTKPNINTPNWYKKYHSVPFVHYLHVAILIIYASFVGILIYNGFFVDASKNKTFAVASPPKILSFQGRLTDENNNPITDTTNVRFQIYSNSEATGSAYLLWQELDQVEPDENGVFSILLGNTTTTCTNGPTVVQSGACPIPTSLFGDNTNLYLGITVEDTPELTPRQQLANVPYATNAQTLEGMLPITNPAAGQSNVILVLDSSGTLSIGGSATPTFQATGGIFTLTGQGLYLKTNEGSGYDIKLEPDGLGKIDLRSPLVNNGDKGNIAPGGVEINDKAAILATESAVAAFIVNNNDVGDIFTASSSGNTQFTIQTNGDVYLAPDVSIDTLSSGMISLGSTNATDIIIGRIGQNITLPALSGQNGIIYGEFGTGNLAQATTTTGGLCLVSGVSSPSWGACTSSSTNPFQQSAGSIFANNSTLDFLLGGQATDSAKFSVVNMNSGTPTASIAGNMIVMPNTSLGNAGGNVGIGTVNPTQPLDVNGTIRQTGAVNCALSTNSSGDLICTSDTSLKDVQGQYTGGIAEVLNINPIKFNYKGEDYAHVGFSAQNIQGIIPEATPLQKNGYLGLDPNAIIALTVNSIKQLNEMVSDLAQSITTQSLNAGSITANSINIATDSVSVAGKSLNEYIASTVEAILDTQYSILNTDSIVSPLAQIDQVRTNMISPLAEDKPVFLNGNALVSGSATVSGSLTAASASISGQLTAENVISDQLSVNDATVSGTLYANNIKADSIEDLDRRIISAYHQQLADFAASGSGQFANGQSSIVSGQLLDITSISSDFGTFRQGLIALGPASFVEASFSDSISIGTTLKISPNSINTVASDLAIQPLRQGAIDFLAGAVRIETDGSLKVANNAYFAKDVSIQGKLKTDNIQPSANGLSIDGSASISGSLTIDKLNLFDAAPAYAISDTEVVATSSAGMDTIKPYRNELTIYNTRVSDKSLIYVSPISPTNNQTPALLRQDPGVSFTVGIPEAVASETKFNWIIVN